MRKLLATLMLILAAQSVWAIDLRDAKEQGLVGEARNGDLAAVTSSVSADVRALIAEVNAKRQAEFEATAAKTGATVVQVRARFYELAVQKTAPGHYYQDASGSWQRK